MRFSNQFRWLFGVGMLITLAGCGPVEDETTATPSPVPVTQAAAGVEPTPEVQAAETPTPRMTFEPAPTAIRVSETPPPTYTPSITPTFLTIPTSTVPLTEDGPWLVFWTSEDPHDVNKLWAMNPDGTGLKKLIDEPVYGYSILPDQSVSDGLTIAYVTSTRVEGPYCIPCGLILKVVNLPDGVVQASIPLLSAEIDAVCDCGDTSEGGVIAVACAGNPVWSPDHTRLAFVGAMDGPSADVYTYDLTTGAITRLSDGPDHANVLSWSPDGRYVIHTAIRPIALQGPEVYGIWAARSDGTGNVPLFDAPPHAEDYDGKLILSGSERVHSWPDPDKVVLISQAGSINSPLNNVRLVDLATGAITYIQRCCYTDYAYDKNRNTWLFLVRADANEDTSPYLIFLENGTERRVDLDFDLSEIWWSEQWDTFIGESFEGFVYQISYAGELQEITQISYEGGLEEFAAPDNPEMIRVSFGLSPDGEWTYWRASGFSYTSGGYDSGLWVTKAGNEPTLVLDEIMDRVFWSPDGSEMYIVSHLEAENFQYVYSLYRLNLPSLEPEFLLGEFHFSGHFEWMP